MAQSTHAPLRLLAPLARTMGSEGVFLRYLIGTDPDHPARVARGATGEPEAVAISGRDVGRFEVYPTWIVARSTAAAEELLGSTGADAFPLALPESLAERATRSFDGAVATLDHIYTLSLPATRGSTGIDRVQRLDEPTLRAIRIDPVLAPLIGSPSDWGAGSRLYGIVDEGSLVAIGDIIVRDDRFGAIQQLYTLEEHRGRGLARRMTAALCALLAAEGRTAVYQVSEANLASIAVARRLGFTLESTIGCVDRPD